MSNADCPHGHVIGNCPICAGLGATGEFPHGKLNEDDEGGLMCAVSIQGDTVRVDFGPKPVAWLAIDPDAAIAFASTIIDRAMAIKLRGAQAMAEAFGETKQ
jgi:hypothetical protein